MFGTETLGRFDGFVDHHAVWHVQAVTQLTAGLATVVGIALSPLTKDPNLVILYTVIAVLTAVAAILFWFFFKGLDRRSEE